MVIVIRLGERYAKRYRSFWVMLINRLDERINSIPYPPLTSNPEENLKGCSGCLFMHSFHKHLLAAL